MMTAGRRESRLEGPRPPTRRRAATRLARTICGGLVAGLIAVPAASAALWAEAGDAGDTVATAQVPAMTEPLTQITGSIGAIAPVGDADIYRVCLGTAGLTAWTLTGSDPVLYLLRPDGSVFSGSDDGAPNSPNSLDAQVGRPGGQPAVVWYLAIASNGDTFTPGSGWSHTGRFSFDYTIVVEGAVACAGDQPPPPPVDTTPPVLNVPNPIVGATSGTGATIAYTATATDDVDGTLPVTCTPPSGSFFPIGTTTVHCTVTDSAGNTANAEFSVVIGGPANQPATGAPVIDDATPTETLPLTASVAAIGDPDNTGPTQAVVHRYQWRSAADAGAAFEDIAGATAPTFTPTQAEVGRVLRVQVSFTDQRGNAEQVESAITGVTGDFIVGTPAADTITGTAGDDVVRGNGGDDTITTLAGDDRIRFSGTAEGFDAVTAGSGADAIEATANTIVGLRSVAETELITGSGANVRIRGSDAADTLSFSATTLVGIVAIRGGAGADTIAGSAARDLIIGGPGDDTINAGSGDDVIRFSGTGDGFDSVTGGNGIDRIEAAVADTVIGLRALASTEQISAPAGQSVVVRGNGASNTISLASVALSGTVDLGGGGGNDALTGTAQADTIHGDAGNDSLNGGAGNDRYVLAPGFGDDTHPGTATTGFDANPSGGQDLLDVTALGVTAGTFAARVTIAAAPVGGTLITVRRSVLATSPVEATVRLASVAPATITASDFTLAP